jgi:N-acetylglutamate synthase-like GNAT family acetyltransferase
MEKVAVSANSNQQGCRIRAATGNDAAVLSALAIRSKAHWGYDQEFMHQCRIELTWSAEQISARQFDFQVCSLDAEPIGFYALERICADVTELEAIFVEPQHIGSGIGRMLMEHANARAISAGAKRMVIQGDPHGGSFYRAIGASECGSRASRSIPGRYLRLYELVLAIESDNTEIAQ